LHSRLTSDNAKPDEFTVSRETTNDERHEQSSSAATTANNINTKTIDMNTKRERLVSFGDRIWTVEGPEVNFFGFPYPTRMAVIALQDGTSWIWSPVALDEELVKEVEEKAGMVQHILSPNKIHHIFMKQWQDRFPEARMYASPGLAERKVAKDLTFYATLGNKPDPAYAPEIDQTLFGEGSGLTEVIFFHKTSKTVLFTDCVQRQEDTSGLLGFLLKLDGMGGDTGGTPGEWRFLMWITGKLPQARETLDHILNDWAPEKFVIAHGKCAHSDAVPVIDKCLSWIPAKNDESVRR
jgi:hypothetical protein